MMKKGLVCVIVVLFIGMSLVPMAGSLSIEQDLTENEIQNFNFGEDTTPPVSNHAVDPGTPDGDNDWYVTPVEITLEATDDLSGVDYIKYLLDDKDWMIYTSPLVIEPDGFHRITYYAVDKAGNVEQPSEVVRFKTDQTWPSAECSHGKVDFNKYKFTVDANDETSGINRVEFWWWNDELQHDELQYIDYEAPYEWVLQMSDVTKEVATLDIILPFYVYDNAGWVTQPVDDGPISKNTYNNLNQKSTQQSIISSTTQSSQLLQQMVKTTKTTNR